MGKASSKTESKYQYKKLGGRAFGARKPWKTSRLEFPGLQGDTLGNRKAAMAGDLSMQ